MVNLKIQCVTFVYFNYLFHAIFGVPMVPNVDFNETMYPVYKQLHTLSLNFSFSLIRLQVSLTSKQTIFLYISCLQAVYFVFLGPGNNLFQYFP